jgi:hypothetical protein
MFNQLDAYRNEGFNVSTICYDSESVLKSIATNLIRERYKVKIISAGRQWNPENGSEDSHDQGTMPMHSVNTPF